MRVSYLVSSHVHFRNKKRYLTVLLELGWYPRENVFCTFNISFTWTFKVLLEKLIKGTRLVHKLQLCFLNHLKGSLNSHYHVIGTYWGCFHTWPEYLSLQSGPRALRSSVFCKRVPGVIEPHLQSPIKDVLSTCTHTHACISSWAERTVARGYRLQLWICPHRILTEISVEECVVVTK